MDEQEKKPYFTKEINNILNEMTDEEMFRHLVNLEGSEAWFALVRYNQIRLGYTQSAIFTADPVTNPTLIARNQGIMLGLSDLQNAVIMMKQEKADEAAGARQLNEDGTEVK